MGRIVPKKNAPRPDNVRPIRRTRDDGGGGEGVGGEAAAAAAWRERAERDGYHTAVRSSAAEFDVFALVDDKGYREDRFYTRSVDGDGHGRRMQIRVPQGLDSQMYEAVATVPEYKTIHDLMRDAIVHRLEFLQKRYNLGEGARRMLELERIRAGMEHRSQETMMMQEAVEDLEAKLAGLYAKEDWAMMVEEFDKGSELLDWLRDPYRTRAGEIMGRWKATTKRQVARMMEMREE